VTGLPLNDRDVRRLGEIDILLMSDVGEHDGRIGGGHR